MATSRLDRLLDPLTDAFTPKMAAALPELRANPELEEHMPHAAAGDDPGGPALA